MKKLICMLMTAVILLSFSGCGKTSTEKARKRAAAGQDTKTASGSAVSADDATQDKGLLSALEYSNAKSNKAGTIYDPNVFLNLSTNTGKEVKIACVGDSITYGTLSSDTETNSYPSQLQKSLNNAFGSKYKVTNYGHPGAYIADFGRSNSSTLRYCKTDEFKQLKKDKPDAVVIMLGINDIGYVSGIDSANELTQAYSDLIKSIQQLPSKPVVYVCTPLVRMTAYSSFVAMPALRAAVINAANGCGAYVIDTYNITKQYFATHLYDTDGLHPDDAGYRYLADSVYNGIVNGYTTYSESDVSETSDYVVYVDSSKGVSSGIGDSPSNPVSSFARAVDLCKGGGSIVVSGPVTPATTAKDITKVFIAQKNAYPITVTSIDPYNGTDYRDTNGAQIFMSGSMYLEGDYIFKSVTFNTVASGVKIVCNYNNMTFGPGFSSTVTSGGNNVLIAGHDVVSVWQSDYDLSCIKDCVLNINSGTFSYLRGGNYRTYTDKDSDFAYGTIKSGVTFTINVTGGSFSNEDGTTNIDTAESRLSSAIGQNGIESGATAVLNISGGTFKGSLFAVPRLNPYYKGTLPEVFGKININISGGAFIGSKIDFSQEYSGMKKFVSNTDYSLDISGGAFASSKKLSFSASSSDTSTLVLSNKYSYLKNWAEINGFSTIK